MVCVCCACAEYLHAVWCESYIVGAVCVCARVTTTVEPLLSQIDTLPHLTLTSALRGNFFFFFTDMGKLRIREDRHCLNQSCKC